MGARIPLSVADRSRAIRDLVLRPGRFVDRAAHHDIASERISNTAFRDSTPSDAPPETVGRFEDAAKQRVRILRAQFRGSVLLFLGAALVGWLLATGMVQLEVGLSAAARSAVIVGALGCFLVSTFARIGWSGQSIKGDTFVEQIDDALFTVWYWVGTAAAVFGALAP